MTVASIRKRIGAESVDVLFLESARFYKLSRAHPDFDRILGELEDAQKSRRVLKVRLASLDSEVLLDIEV
jgi:hypothetical protein